MTEYLQWKKRVYQAIEDVSDLAFQHRAWSTLGPEVSSFVETYSTLYDDCSFPKFLALDATVWQQLGLTVHTRQEMEILRCLMNAYQEPDTHAAILADPKWQAVVKQAQRVLEQ
jgi:hypothetical protein